MSWYLTIRSDPQFSKSTPTPPLIDFLKGLPELKQADPMRFEGGVGAPEVSVVVAACDERGNYSSPVTFQERVNIIELTCSHAGDTDWYHALAGKIAKFLGWKTHQDDDKTQM